MVQDDTEKIFSPNPHQHRTHYKPVVSIPDLLSVSCCLQPHPRFAVCILLYNFCPPFHPIHHFFWFCVFFQHLVFCILILLCVGHCNKTSVQYSDHSSLATYMFAVQFFRLNDIMAQNFITVLPHHIYRPTVLP